jgi:hypothetical protein
MSLPGPAGESSPQAASAASATRPHRDYLFAGKRPLLYLDMVSSFRADARGRVRCPRWAPLYQTPKKWGTSATSPGGAIPGLGRRLGSKTNVRSSSRIQEAHHFLTDLDNTNAERPFGSSAILGSFGAPGGSNVWRRGGKRGPVALRPRLSPGVPLSRDGKQELGVGTRDVNKPSRAKGTLCTTVLTADELQRLAS